MTNHLTAPVRRPTHGAPTQQSAVSARGSVGSRRAFFTTIQENG